MNSNENAIQEQTYLDEFNWLDEWSQDLESELEEGWENFDLLDEDRKKINNPDSLGKVIGDVVWDQFKIQIGVVGGEDFKEENRGQTLDLSSDAHIQNPEDFERQKYATHNQYIDYEKRGEEYRSNFYTNPDEKPHAKQRQNQRYNKETKVWETYDPVDEEWQKALKPDYRAPYEDDRRKDKSKFGNKTINKDHQVSDAKIARDSEAGAYMTLDEKVKAANSTDNLNDLDRAANESKSDHDGEKWAKHKRTGSKGTGQTNAEYFGLDEDEYVEKDRKSKAAYEDKKTKKKEEEVALGKKSRRKEAANITDKALRSVVLGMLADLIREIIGKLVIWFKSKEKSVKSFVSQVKIAVSDFFKNVKQRLLTAATTMSSTIITSISDKIASVLRKALTIIKQGGKLLKDGIEYVKNPENRKKTFGELMLGLTVLTVTSLTAIGGVALGTFIEGKLMLIPGLGMEIPLLGSLASIIGIFLGAIIAGTVSAIIINIINRIIARKKRAELEEKTIEQGNKMLAVEHTALLVEEIKLETKQKQVYSSIKNTHESAKKVITDSLDQINDNINSSSAIINQNLGTATGDAMLELIKKELGSEG